jgi:tight adherence protein B
MSPTLLSLVIFGAVTCGLLAGYSLLSGLVSRETLQALRRMRRELRPGAGEPAAPSPLFKNPEQLSLDPEPAPARAAPRSDVLPLVRPRAGLRPRLETLLAQADVPVSLRQLLTFAAGLGLALGVAGTLFRGPLLGAGAAAVGAVAPLLAVHFRRKARREKLLTSLPNAFGLMARVLRADNSVPQALQAVADTVEGPLAAEFARCQKQQSLGIRPEVTFHEMAERTGLLEVRIFVSAMLIQRQAGGNLSEMLERLAALIRDRVRLRKQVRTLTAEGRLQGLTLLLLPFLVFGALMFINRPYAEVLLEHPSLLAATAAVMGVGVVWIRKIVNFDF